MFTETTAANSPTGSTGIISQSLSAILGQSSKNSERILPPPSSNNNIANDSNDIANIKKAYISTTTPSTSVHFTHQQKPPLIKPTIKNSNLQIHDEDDEKLE